MSFLINPYRFGGIAPALVEYIGSSVIGSAGTTGNTIALPSGSASGDLAIFTSSGNSTAKTTNTPAGWTRILSYTGLLQSLYAFYKVLDSGDITAGSVTITYNTSNVYGQIVMYSLRGADSGTITLSTPYADDVVSTAHTSSSKTGGADDFLISVHSVRALVGVSSVPSGMTAGAGNAGVGMSKHTAYLNQAGTPTGDKTLTLAAGSSGKVGLQIGVSPA